MDVCRFHPSTERVHLSGLCGGHTVSAGRQARCLSTSFRRPSCGDGVTLSALPQDDSVEAERGRSARPGLDRWSRSGPRPAQLRPCGEARPSRAGRNREELARSAELDFKSLHSKFGAPHPPSPPARGWPGSRPPSPPCSIPVSSQAARPRLPLPGSRTGRAEKASPRRKGSTKEKVITVLFWFYEFWRRKL